MRHTSLLLVSLLLSQQTYGAFEEAWNSFSAPEIMSYSLRRKFSELPLKGHVIPSSRYWSGDYWALQKGSINYRWYSRKKMGFNYASPTKEEAMRMGIQELAGLSPAEKYDLFTGRYDYPLKAVVAKLANPNAEFWEGMCHGWSPATMNHEEPSPQLMRNPDGIYIPFGSTDIKALLSFYYGYIHRAPDTHQMGRRCYSSHSRDPECGNDLNAGAFHIVLTNRISFEGEGIILDLEPLKEVWNHPVTSYETQILKEKAPLPTSAPGTQKVLMLRTKITYLDENGHDWHQVKGTSKQAEKSAVYEYFIEIDETSEIIGGEWISKQRPDFLWIMRKTHSFEGSLSRLGELLNE